MRKFDVCIIGGGAAGLAAAASLRNDIEVCIFDKNEIPGRKLMATGGGRCNITNEACAGRGATLDFFASIGIETYRDEEGRYYPYTNRASDVQKALIRAQRAKVTAFYGAIVDGIKKQDDKQDFTVTARQGNGKKVSVRATCVLLAAGGKAAPQYGTTGDGYRLAWELGHTVERVYPILAPVECADDMMDFSRLKGIRAKGKVALCKDGQLLEHVASETGEIQFTADGLSGICIFNLTPYIQAEPGEKVKQAMERYSIAVDLAPDFSADALKKRTSCFGILTDELAETADEEMKRRGCGPEFIKDWHFAVKNVKGWRYAQCTAGGVCTEEVDLESGQSKRIPGLFFAGEILDIQGPCGGFNLQNAWETGRKAAAAINAIVG